MAPAVRFLHGDASILERIRRGDEEALVTLYRENRGVIAGYVLHNHGTADDAEDLLQEAVVVLWERVRAGNFEYTSKLSTFLFGVVRNMWLRRLARRRREMPEAAGREDPPDPDASPLDLMMEDERTAALGAALHRLGNPCRELLLLYYYEELTMEQIAERMGFANADTAKSKKYQCKKALAQLVKAGYDG